MVDDLNFHLDKKADNITLKFTDMPGWWVLNSTSINPLTSRHTLDVIMCRDTDNLVQEVQVGYMITDHHLLLCNVHHPKPKMITRAFRSINLPSFRTDIAQGLGNLDDSLSVTDLLDIYDTQLTNVLNKHVPSKKKLL